MADIELTTYTGVEVDYPKSEATDDEVEAGVRSRLEGHASLAEVTDRGVQLGDMVLVELTAKDGDLDETEALDIGADDYLRKPFSFDVLAARLRALVRRTGRSTEQVLHASGLEIDTAKRTVSRDGTDIELSTTEFDLLLALASRSG